MKAKFLGNIGTKKLHALGYTDGRCHITRIRKEQQVEFSTLEEAMKYPDSKGPIFCKCGICFQKWEQENKGMERKKE